MGAHGGLPWRCASLRAMSAAYDLWGSVTRVLQLSSTLHGGGAVAAAARIAHSVDPYVDLGLLMGGSGLSSRLRSLPRSTALHLQQSSNSVHRSVNVIPSSVARNSNLRSTDVIHLHWVGDELLSVRQIGALSTAVPVVWTLHDTWAFTGADHHPKDESDNRYRAGYTQESRLPGDGRIDVDAWVFRRKLKAWKSPIWLVAPSSYIQNMANESYLASSWPTTVIPNPLDTDVYRPLEDGEQIVARAELGLPADVPVVLFGSASRAAHTKGMDLLAKALERLRIRLPGATFATFGPVAEDLPDWVRQLGYVDSEEQLRRLYSAADAVVVSSRFETFSQVAAEAQACGTPVAAFATSGLLDVVEDGVTGFLAEPYEPEALAEAMIRVIEAGPRMREAARKRAERLWAMDVVGRQYVAWYEQAISEFHSNLNR